MLQASKRATLVVALAASVASGAVAVAQSTLAQLGLTETAARNFLLEEIKSRATIAQAPSRSREPARF